MKGIHRVYQDQAGADGAGAGGGGAADAGAAGGDQSGQGGGQPAGGDGGKPASSSVLAGKEAGQGQAPGEGQGFEWIPEKHRVTKEDGTIDLEASSRKTAEAYAHLSQKMGTGEAPPKTPEEYAPELTVEGPKWDDLKGDPKMQAFIKGAHGKGITNAQLSYILDGYLAAAPELLAGGKALTQEQVATQLKEVWKDPAEFERNVGAYYKTAEIIAAKAGVKFTEAEMLNPTFIRMMAAIAPEFQEDTSANNGGGDGAGGGGEEAEINALMQSEAYQNPKHQDYATTSKRVKAFFEKKYGTKQSL